MMTNLQFHCTAPRTAACSSQTPIQLWNPNTQRSVWFRWNLPGRFVTCGFYLRSRGAVLHFLNNGSIEFTQIINTLNRPKLFPENNIVNLHLLHMQSHRSSAILKSKISQMGHIPIQVVDYMLLYFYVQTLIGWNNNSVSFQRFNQLCPVFLLAWCKCVCCKCKCICICCLLKRTKWYLCFFLICLLAFCTRFEWSTFYFHLAVSPVQPRPDYWLSSFRF